MDDITSLFDLFNKAKTDERYRRLAVLTYEDHYGGRGDFEKAKHWFENWAVRNVDSARFKTCRRMVDHINTFIHRVEAGELPIGEQPLRDADDED